MLEYKTEEERLEAAIKTFQVAKTKSEFYRNKYRQIERVSTLEEWRTIPMLTRDELYKNSYPRSLSMLTCPLEDMIVVSTGGSSGLARYTVLTHAEWDHFCEVQAQAIKLLGVNSRDIVANFMVAGNLWPSFLGAHEVIKRLRAVHLPLAVDPNIERLVDYILEFNPTVLMGLPTLFVFLADTILKKGTSVDSVRLIGFAGEAMSSTVREHMKRAFPNAETKALAYSSADCGLMGYQCAHCGPNEYHIPTGFQFIEIIDIERNLPCQEEEEGEIVVTNLARLSMPIIRYRLGDMARFKKGTCPCGDPNPLMILEGRAGDDFKLGGAYISMRAVEKALSPFWKQEEISPNYALELEDIDGNRMRFTLKIESTDPARAEKLAPSIKDALKEAIHELQVGTEMDYIRLEVVFVPLGSLPRSPITGKIKRLHDKRIQE